MKLNKADESALIIALTELLQRGEVTSYEYAPIGQGWEDAVFGSLSEDGQSN